jgi:hypothetical protein
MNRSICVYSSHICIPVAYPYLRCPTIYWGLVCPCNATRCVNPNPNPPNCDVPNNMTLGADHDMPNLVKITFRMGLCISSQSFFVDVVAGVPYPRLGM